MRNVILQGGCIYSNVILKDMEKMNDKTLEIQNIKDKPFVYNYWDASSVLNITFDNQSLSGSDIKNDFSNIKYFEVYKTYGNQETFYKVGETINADNCIIEDFNVGNRCLYTYYIIPILKDSNTNNTVGSIMKSNTIELNDNTIRIIGLIQDENDLNKYYIDVNNIWNIYINLENDGFSNNLARTYNDTFNKYQKEIVGNGSYRTLSIKGDLSKVNCPTKELVDSYDHIVEWEKFINSPSLKLLIDLRGIVTLGSIESNSFEYDPDTNLSISVNFNFRELSDIDSNELINPLIKYNPIKSKLLMSSEPNVLLSTETDLQSFAFLSKES